MTKLWSQLVEGLEGQAVSNTMLIRNASPLLHWLIGIMSLEFLFINDRAVGAAGARIGTAGVLEAV